ncbi:MAG: VOC family protein [Alphaproteobacteria bacterium]|nr:VOC family protein [Alphaproteobacteria bacterium]
MPAPEYGRSLSGLTVNLLVRDIETALAFQREVLGAEIVYCDQDFAVLRSRDAEWMLHADHTYQDHPLYGSLSGELVRGIGSELRLHSRDPDEAEQAAREHGYTVLDGASDKPHGLREAYILDPDGYLWVPDVPSSD